MPGQVSTGSVTGYRVPYCDLQARLFKTWKSPMTIPFGQRHSNRNNLAFRSMLLGLQFIQTSSPRGNPHLLQSPGQPERPMYDRASQCLCRRALWSKVFDPEASCECVLPSQQACITGQGRGGFGFLAKL